ncbi:General transcription factor IIH subunit 1, partial [Smittium culicis]
MWEENEIVELSSETILQKKEGVLYCTNTRIAWVLSNSSKIAISVPFIQIKNQQVSTQDASRVKLRLLVNSDNGGNDVVYTFLWKELDREIARTERDAFKNSLAIKMSRARQSTAAETKPEGTSSSAKTDDDSATNLKKRKILDSGAASNISEHTLKIRQLILSNNEELLHLHKNLVQSGIIPEEEFWETRK